MKTQIGNRMVLLVCGMLGWVVLTGFSAPAPAAVSPRAQNAAAVAPAALAGLPDPAVPISAAVHSANSSIRIAFAPGTTSGSVSGTLVAQGVQSYILNAMGGQWMTVSAASSNGAVFLEIHGVSDGVFLTTFANVQTSWQGWLPRTQAYIIRVYNSSTAPADYTLSVVIPARIRFATGTFGATIFGAGFNAQVITYILFARGGQTFTATLSSTTNSVVLALHGLSDGQFLVQSSAADTTWTGTLPSSQEYILEAVQTGTWVGYTLTVTIV